jgi:hypothetical protein
MKKNEYIKKYRLQGKISDYKVFRDFQKFDKLEDADEFVQDLINNDIKIILKKYPETEKIYITGSYFRGDFINEKTPLRFKNAINTFRKNKKASEFSDRDYVIFPNHHEQMNVEMIKDDVNILSENKNKLLIWEK